LNDADATFYQLRARLQGIAYRMLGSMAEAEDVVQDVWLRWHDTGQAAIKHAEAWLVSTTTRASIDKLRSLKARREHYVGIWLPEPVLTDGPATPEQIQELSSDVSVAFLSLLERLSPEARAAFLLREVFDADYDEIANILDKTEAACRQIVHRAKSQLSEQQPRYAIAPESRLHLTQRFAQALSEGSFGAMKSMLADNAKLLGDGGGKVLSFPVPLVGGQRIAQLLYASNLRYKDALRIELVSINGQPAVLRYINGELESAHTYEIDDGRIVDLRVQRNPQKLERLAAAKNVALFFREVGRKD
jgi:RNA polymerase sigma-70 factor (ECF subfamily)